MTFVKFLCWSTRNNMSDNDDIVDGVQEGDNEVPTTSNLEDNMAAMAASLVEIKSLFTTVLSDKLLGSDSESPGQGLSMTPSTANKRHSDAECGDQPPPPKHQKCDTEDSVSDLFSDAEGEDVVKEDEDDLHILEQIDDAFQEADQVSPPVNDKLAAKINGRFRVALNVDKVIEKQKAYLRPQNCQNIGVPRCNQEIWHRLSTVQRREDVRMTNIQRAIHSRATAISQILDLLPAGAKNKAKLDIPCLVAKGCDALALLGHASHEMSFRRRRSMSSALKREYSGLVSPNVPVTDNLFGDDLMKTVRDLKQEHFLGNTATRYTAKNDQRRGKWSYKRNWDHRQNPKKQSWDKNKGSRDKVSHK